jgi:CheY-like chemotaxis protein
MSGRVLVVDDSATIRRLVRSIVEEAGYEVSSAPDGQAALDLLQRESFDVALLDFVMPRLNGYQLAQAIRAMPHLKTLPLVLMSAKADVIGPRFIQQTQAAHSITKPFEPNALLAVVGHALSSRTRPSMQPLTLVNEELARSASIPPPAPEPPRTTARPSPKLSAPPSPAARAVAKAEMDLQHAPVPRDRTATVLARPRIDTAHDQAPVVPWAEVPDDGERTVVGLLPLDGYDDFDADAVSSVEVADPRTTALQTFAQAVLRPIERGAPKLDRSKIGPALTDAATADDLRAIIDAARTAIRAIEGGAKTGLEGDIDLVPLGEVLQMLRFQQQTGVLAVNRAGAAVELCFYRGSIELALARNVAPEFLLGRYAVAAGVVTQDELDGLLRSGVRGRLGEALMSSGRLDAEGLERLLTRQSSEILYEVCRWREGNFEFLQGVRRPEAQSAALGLPVEALVLEGFRRVDEWGQIEQEVRSFEDVFTADAGVVESVGAARLSPSERKVLETLDGRRTVNEVIVRSHMNSFDVCKTLFQLRRARLIRRRGA